MITDKDEPRKSEIVRKFQVQNLVATLTNNRGICMSHQNMTSCNNYIRRSNCIIQKFTFFIKVCCGIKIFFNFFFRYTSMVEWSIYELMGHLSQLYETVKKVEGIAKKLLRQWCWIFLSFEKTTPSETIYFLNMALVCNDFPQHRWWAW